MPLPVRAAASAPAVAVADYLVRSGAAAALSRAVAALGESRHPDPLRFLADHFAAAAAPPEPVSSPEDVTVLWLEQVLGLRQGSVAAVHVEPCVGGARRATFAVRSPEPAAVRIGITAASSLPYPLSAAVPRSVILKIFAAGAESAVDEAADSVAAAAAEARASLLLREAGCFSGGSGAGLLRTAPLLWYRQGKAEHGEWLANLVFADLGPTPQGPPVPRRPVAWGDGSGARRTAVAFARLHAAFADGAVPAWGALPDCGLHVYHSIAAGFSAAVPAAWRDPALPPWGRREWHALDAARARRWRWLPALWTGRRVVARLAHLATDDWAQRLSWSEAGALLGPVQRGSDADEAGLREGMRLVSVDGHTLASPEAMRRLLCGLAPEPDPAELKRRKPKGDAWMEGIGPPLGERRGPPAVQPRHHEIVAEDLGGLTALAAALPRLLESRSWKAMRTVCHGNADGRKVSEAADGGVAVLDFADAYVGNPAADLARWALWQWAERAGMHSGHRSGPCDWDFDWEGDLLGPYHSALVAAGHRAWDYSNLVACFRVAVFAEAYSMLDSLWGPHSAERAARAAGQLRVWERFVSGRWERYSAEQAAVLDVAEWNCGQGAELPASGAYVHFRGAEGTTLQEEGGVTVRRSASIDLALQGSPSEGLRLDHARCLFGIIDTLCAPLLTQKRVIPQG
eukprot:TRINITY_DN2066_c1_g1_i1.p1 TRINITY_DN2066_c1_g1~~TRINITY_DN2066_c1_g1_i1.p1  ORF type:complete len:685 (+),score=165.00 TRINITY_DN2066_c1_g1_i1:69-2123(+)